MNTLVQSLPFVAAIALLVAGVLRFRRFLFVASFGVLLMACIFTLASDGTSGAFNFIGGFVLLFGLVCGALCSRLRPGHFVSRSGLGVIGAVLFGLGFFGMMLL